MKNIKITISLLSILLLSSSPIFSQKKSSTEASKRRRNATTIHTEDADTIDSRYHNQTRTRITLSQIHIFNYISILN